MIKNLQRKVKNIFLHKNFKESLYYKNCMAGRKLLLLFFIYLFIIWEQNTETEKIGGFWLDMENTLHLK